MIDVSELMTDPDFARSVTLRRPSGGFSEDGTFSSTYHTREIEGIVQPATPEEIVLLPEGSRLNDIISVWSAQELRAGDGKRQEADVIIVDKKPYRVVRAEPWPDAGYFRVFAEGYTP